MITRPESCTREDHASSPPLRGRTLWHLALALGGVTYLALVLFYEVESPVFSIVLILLVAYELVRSHSGAGTTD